MKIRTLNTSGFAHHFVLALAIMGIVSAFAFQAVAGNAQSTKASQTAAISCDLASSAAMLTYSYTNAPKGATLYRDNVAIKKFNSQNAKGKITDNYSIQSRTAPKSYKLVAGSKTVVARCVVSQLEPATPCIVNAQREQKFLSKAECDAVQKAASINAQGLYIVQCSYINPQGKVYKKQHTSPFCDKITQANAVRLADVQQKCATLQPRLSTATANTNYACTLLVQTKLVEKGVDVKKTGTYTTNTAAGVKAYQQEKKFKVANGAVDRCTWTLVMTGDAPASCKK